MSTGQLQTRESFGDEMAEAAHLKERLEGLQSELQFEENIEKALLLSSKMTPEQLRESRLKRTPEEREAILKKVGTNFIESLHVSAPPGVPIDRGKMRSSASLIGRTQDANYVEPDSPRTQARKEFDKKYPKLEYTGQKHGSLKPLSPRARAAYEAAAAEVYHSETKHEPEDTELTAEFHESVQHLKETTTPDYKSLAMEIYKSTEDGMEKRAIRRLQQVEGERGEKEFREKAFHVYRTDYAKEEFGDAAQDLNADDYLWQREPGTGASEFAKREEEKNLFGYRSKRMQQPPHRGQFKELIAAEKKDRGMPYLVEPEPEGEDEDGWKEEAGLDDPPPPPPNMDDEVPFTADEIKKKDAKSLKLCLKCCGCCTMIAIFFAPLLGLLAVAGGCDAETRQLEQKFDAMNVKMISVLKDRGDVRIEILPPPQLPSVLNDTGGTYGVVEQVSEKITVTSTHFARTQTALAEVYTHVRQSGGCQPLNDYQMRLVLQRYNRPYVDGLSPILVNQIDDLLKNPPRFMPRPHPCNRCTCNRDEAVCVQCERPLTLSVVNWWSENFNSLYDCPRSEIVVKIPRNIMHGVAGDFLEWDKELEDYVYGGSRLVRNEFALSVEVNATVPSGWLMPIAGDIQVTGQNDVVLSDVNLTTNAGGIVMEQLSAWKVKANATGGGGVNATLVSSPDLTVVAQADTIYGNLLPTRSTAVGEVILDYIDLEKWQRADLDREYEETGTADCSYKSRKTGYMGDVYAGDDAGASALGHLQVFSELAPITLDRVVHGNISFTMSVEDREVLSPTVDLDPLNDADISMNLNVFEYQGVYSLQTARGDVMIEDAGCDAIVELEQTGDDDDSGEPSFKAGRIGNTRDTRTLSPMSRRIRVDARVADYTDVDVTVNLDCADFTRCKLDCSRRGLCTPDTGTCACDPSDFYNKSTRFYGDGCEFTYCPNDCSGQGSCDRMTGECTCFDRWYEADYYFPCTHIICADGPRKNEMECGHCNVEWNTDTAWVYGSSIGVTAFDHRSRNRNARPGNGWLGGAMTCAPIDFLTPSVTATMRIDDLMLFQNNPHVIRGINTVDMGKALSLLNETSPASEAAHEMIAAALSAILAIHIPPANVGLNCEAGYTGMEGSWNEVEPTTAADLASMARQDLDVSCETAYMTGLPVRGGLPDAERMGMLPGVTLPMSRRRQAQVYDPVDYLDNPVLANNSLLQSLGLAFSCPGNCTGPSGFGGICNESSGSCICNQGRFRDDCYYTTCPGDPLHPTIPGDVECSGAGTCNYLSGICSCISGRAGEDCSMPDVPCRRMVCDRNGCYCGSRFQGSCDRTTGECTCTEFFMGDDCALQVSPCGEDCPGRSYCDGYIGECVCPPVSIRQWGEEGRTNVVRTFENVLTYGFGCALAPCLIPLGLPSETNATRETNCHAHTGNGVCNTYTGECECALGYDGEECESRECPVMLDALGEPVIDSYGERVLCSGHGVCNFTSGICMCETEYDPEQGGLVDCSRLLCQDPSSETGYGLTCGG